MDGLGLSVLKRLPRIYAADVGEILAGEATDIYFVRTREIVEKYGVGDKLVRMEVHAYSLPEGYEWAVYAGVEEALALLQGKPVTVYSLPEGTIFRRKDPLMVVEGRFKDIIVYETALLGLLRFSTSIASRAARARIAAGKGKTVLFFGLRALHPAVQPAADRAALVGGLDGISGVLSGKYLGVKPRGTMPHALIIVFGRQVDAWKAFAETFAGEAPVIALVDTFFDEREEALMAARELGEVLEGVRLDTPSSRRGRMRDIVEEVRWSLDIHGYRHVKVFVSGGLDEEKIRELRDVADGFGVGTTIAAPPNIDISMDVVEVYEDGEWRPRTKRGKLPGARALYACGGERKIGLLEKPPDGCTPADSLMKTYIRNGEIIEDMPSLGEIREYVLRQLEDLGYFG
ncbi:MAG: nicotinate phosphoribosyltransferase [Aeropyrum sp.]|nr:nicotinate phosphoribosyltransferase [Aeropyrum sp.]